MSSEKSAAPAMDALLGDRLMQAREAKGYTQEELAMRVGVKTVTVEDWEAERSYPRANRLAQLAGILNVPLTWLLAGAETLAEAQEGRLESNDIAGIDRKLVRVDALLLELNSLVGEIRRDTRQLQQSEEGALEEVMS